jgi:hypothetical protein
MGYKPLRKNAGITRKLPIFDMSSVADELSECGGEGSHRKERFVCIF